MKYKLDLPYPEIKVEKQNEEYAFLLSKAYAGRVSEDTAIHQYMYQSVILNDELSTILETIGIVEMRHLEMLAKLINLLGQLPKYEANDEDWSAKYVPYPVSVIDMLKADIESETLAIFNYEKLLLVIDDKYIQEVIKRIILDEQLHLKIFNELLLKYN